MRILYFFCFISSFLVEKSFGQGAELELGGGMSNYNGDLQPSYFTTKNARPYFSANMKYGFNSHVYLRGGLSIAAVRGIDDPKLTGRNLDFSSKIQEINLGLEYRLISPDRFPVTPYAFVCIGAFHFDPTTVYNGSVVHLQPLGTEGEGLPQYPTKKMYALTQFCIPFGGGLKWAVNDDVNVGFEIGERKLFTDYLDDVSGTYADQQILLAARGQTAVNLAYRAGGGYPPEGSVRGNPKHNDWYYFFGLTIGVKLYDSQTGELSLGGLIKNRRGSTACPR